MRHAPWTCTAASGVLLRTVVIGLTAFLTVVDLFATQAILPSLTRAYSVTPAAMGFAVNASTWAWRWPGSPSRCSASASIAGWASWSASRCCRSRRRCWRSRPTSRHSRCCGSRRGCAWHRPSR